VSVFCMGAADVVAAVTLVAAIRLVAGVGAVFVVTADADLVWEVDDVPAERLGHALVVERDNVLSFHDDASMGPNLILPSGRMTIVNTCCLIAQRYVIHVPDRSTS